MEPETGDKMYFDILDPKRLDILKTICETDIAKNFYLAGGTALSLQIKLRKSFDFDFFSEGHFNENVLYGSIKSLFPNKVEVITLNKGTCNLFVDGIQISFLEYPYSMINPLISGSEIKNLSLASTDDIAAMKMAAIGDRGAKKDFFDLYQIFNYTEITSDKLIYSLQKKFGENFNFSYMLMGLDYFEDAEDEVLPELFVKFDWNKAKKFFVQKKKELTNLFYSEISKDF